MFYTNVITVDLQWSNEDSRLPAQMNVFQYPEINYIIAVNYFHKHRSSDHHGSFLGGAAIPKRNDFFYLRRKMRLRRNTFVFFCPHAKIIYHDQLNAVNMVLEKGVSHVKKYFFKFQNR